MLLAPALNAAREEASYSEVMRLQLLQLQDPHQ